MQCLHLNISIKSHTIGATALRVQHLISSTKFIHSHRFNLFKVCRNQTLVDSSSNESRPYEMNWFSQRASQFHNILHTEGKFRKSNQIFAPKTLARALRNHHPSPSFARIISPHFLKLVGKKVGFMPKEAKAKKGKRISLQEEEEEEA